MSGPGLDNIFTSCDDGDITDLSPEYVDCVEVCYNEIEMERANGQEVDSLRVRLKGDSPTSNLNRPPHILHF